MSVAVYQDKAAKRAAAAAEIFAGHRTWSYGRRRADGHPFFVVPGSPVRERQPDGSMLERPVAWYADQNGCNCDARKWASGEPCKHMLAVRLWFEAWKRGEIVIPARATSRDRAVLEAEHAAIEDRDAAAATSARIEKELFYRAKEAATQREDVAKLEWWQHDDGRPVWLQPEDRYEPDHVPAADAYQPDAAAIDTTRPDPRDPAAPFPSWMTSAERIQAQIEQLDREDAADGREELILTPAEEAALAAYEEHQTSPRDYRELFPDDDD
jgi:hypothetical protein